MKTSNSQKKAVRAYEESKDIIRGIFPKGTKDRIISAGYTYNGFLNEAVERFFHDLETPTAPILEPTESVSQIEKETKEVDQMPSAEVMPWEEGYTESKPDPVYEQEMKEVNDVKAKYYVRKYGESILTDSVIQGEILLTCGGEVLAKVKEYVDHPELLEEPEQEQPKQEDDKITLENWQKQIDENRAEEIKKLEEEEEQRKKRREEWQTSTKNEIFNHVKRMRNGSEMTEEEKKKEAEREEWKKKNNKEFGV